MPQPIQLGPAFTNPPKKVPPLQVAVRAPSPVPAPAPVAVKATVRAPASSPAPAPAAKAPQPKKPGLKGLLSYLPGESKIEKHSGMEKTVKKIEDARDGTEGGMAATAGSKWLLNRQTASGVKKFVTTQAAKAAKVVGPKVIGGAGAAGKFVSRRIPHVNAVLAAVDFARTTTSPKYRDEARKSVDKFSPAKRFSGDAARQALDRPFATVHALARAAGEASPGMIDAYQGAADASYNLDKQRMNTRLRDRGKPTMK
jgi:hypothetical protein